MRCNIHSWRLQVSPRSINYWIGFYHFIHYVPRRRYIALSMFFSSCVGPRLWGYGSSTRYLTAYCLLSYLMQFRLLSSLSTSLLSLLLTYLPNPLPPSKSFIRNNTIKETPGYVWAPNTVLMRAIVPWKGLHLCGLPWLGYLYVLNIKKNVMNLCKISLKRWPHRPTREHLLYTIHKVYSTLLSLLTCS